MSKSTTTLQQAKHGSDRDNPSATIEHVGNQQRSTNGLSGGENPEVSSTEQLASLREILKSRQEDSRFYRNAFLSTVATSFTVPLGALTVQHPEMFRQARLFFLPRPALCIASLWGLGILSIAYGIYRVVPRPKRGATPEYWIDEASKAAEKKEIKNAFDFMRKAIDCVQNDLNKTLGSRWFFYTAFAAFVLALLIEFALVLTFSPTVGAQICTSHA